MPFLAPVFAAVGTAVTSVAAWAAASPILAGIVQTAFGIAAKYALAAIFPAEKPKAAASQLETQYGEDIVRSVGMGKYGTNGHHVYRNAYGEGNRRIQDVYIVSHFRTKELLRIRIDGEWRGIEWDHQDSEGFYEVAGIEGVLRIKFYNGTMGQQADPSLIQHANPPGRWTTDHRGAGISYVIVYQKLDREKRTSPVKPFFEIDGAPLYDWRKDTTAGGDGPHRWNDQSTWGGDGDYNTAVQMYNLERGFYNGTELMVGKGVNPGRLPISEWTQAADICDEVGGDGVRRYTSSLIATSGMNTTHDSNMQPLLEASAASWVETVTGEFPMVGAPQTVVATITDDDIIQGKPKRFSRYRPRVELINTVAATYSNPATFYESEAAATRIDATALAFDRERLASAITYSAVTEPKQVDRLADIAIRGARYQANAEICIKPKYLDVAKAGRWIRWNSAEHGDFTYQIVSVSHGPFGPDGTRLIYLTLREIANGVFDPTAYQTNPPVTLPVGPPQYLAEVQNFVPTPIYVTGDDGGKLPGVLLQWNTFDDVTVTHVKIEYRPVSDPSQVFTKVVERDVTVVPIVEGLTSNSDWEFRTILITSPVRPVAPSAWTLVRTFEIEIVIPDVDLGNLGQDIQDVLQGAYDKIREIARQAQAQALLTSNQQMGDYLDRQEIRRSLQSTYQTTRAEYLEVIQVATGPNSALATSITSLEAEVFDPVTGIPALASSIQLVQSQITVIDGQVSGVAQQVNDLNIQYGNLSANALFDMEAVAAPSGWTSRIAMRTRVTTGDSFKEAGLYMDATTSQSRIALIADQIVMASGTNLAQPFTFVSGVLTLMAANIGTVTAGLLRSPDLKFQIQLSNRRMLIAD